MKTSEVDGILLIIFVSSTLTSAVLTGHQNRDITDERQFGCSWLGGASSGAVVCSCREDAGEMNITENSISTFDTSSIEIANCAKVRFGSNAVANMRNLRNIYLKNIQSLNFEQSSMNWYGYREATDYEERFDFNIPSLVIKLDNCYINQLSSYTFEGRINTIHFDRVIVENLESFAFNALMQTKSIILRNSEFKKIKPQPFKKFSAENIELEGVRADLLPSRYFSNITVHQNFLIKNCSLGTIRPGAFIIHSPTNFEVSETRIGQLDGEAFKVITRNDVLFKNNTFDVINDGAFSGIIVDRDEVFRDLTMIFDSNVFKDLTRDSLTVSKDFHVKFSNIKINSECDCKTIGHKITYSAFYNDFNCLYDSKFVTVKEYKENMCSIVSGYLTPIIIVGVVLVLCFIIGTVLFIYYKKVYLSRKYGKRNDSKKGNISLIVPDGRTYRETELHVIVERADLLTTDL